MDFSQTDEQKAIVKSIIVFAKKELNDDIAANDHNGVFPKAAWSKCSKMGYNGLSIPAEFGGLGLDLVTTVMSLNALSYGCRDGGLVHAIVTQNCCATMLATHGSKKLKDKYLQRVAKGELVGAQAITEPDAGSDISSMQTTASKNGEQYVLNGSKIYITNGPIADVILVFAVSDPGKSVFGRMSCFLLESKTNGLSSGTALDKMGLRTLQNSELFFNNCSIPESNLIGNEGRAMFVFNEAIEYERVLMAACHLGSMQRVFESCLKYAKSRKQFGSRILNYQSISNKIADMKSFIEMGRLVLYKAAWLKDKKMRATMESSIAKLFISEKLKQTCTEAVQIHGAYGFMKEAEIERDLRDSIAATIYSGTSEIQRNIISKLSGI